ncbi:hypothetical protein EMIT0194P_60239 [Pseudomonas serbica]
MCMICIRILVCTVVLTIPSFRGGHGQPDSTPAGCPQRQRICHKTGALTQTFDFACGLSHCAVGLTGINFANFTQRPLTVPLELFSQHETDSAAPRCASA